MESKKKINQYLFIAYEMYVKNVSKEDLDNNINGIQLLMEIDDFNRWLKEQNITI